MSLGKDVSFLRISTPIILKAPGASDLLLLEFDCYEFEDLISYLFSIRIESLMIDLSEDWVSFLLSSL